MRASLPLAAQAWRSPGRRLPQPATFPSQVQSRAAPDSACRSRASWRSASTRQLRPGLKLAVDLLAVRGKRQIGPIDFNPHRAGARAGQTAERRRRTSRHLGDHSSSSPTTGRAGTRGLTVSLHERAARWESAGVVHALRGRGPRQRHHRSDEHRRGSRSRTRPGGSRRLARSASIRKPFAVRPLSTSGTASS